MNENHSITVKDISLEKVLNTMRKTTYKRNKLYSLSTTIAGKILFFR